MKKRGFFVKSLSIFEVWLLMMFSVGVAFSIGEVGRVSAKTVLFTKFILTHPDTNTQRVYWVDTVLKEGFVEEAINKGYNPTETSISKSLAELATNEINNELYTGIIDLEPPSSLASSATLTGAESAGGYSVKTSKEIIKSAEQSKAKSILDGLKPDLNEKEVALLHAVERGDKEVIKQAQKDYDGAKAEYDKIAAAAGLAGGAGAIADPNPKLFGVGGPTVKGWFKGHLVEGVHWGLAVAGAVQMVGRMAGADEKVVNALSLASLGGFFVGKGVYGLLGGAIKEGVISKAAAGWLGFGVGAAVAFGIFYAMYKKEKKEIVSFQCLPFEPPRGGAKCEECNKDEFRPCSEYRCKSLGQACELVNAGTEEEKCIWKNRNDVNSPTITPWAGALYPDKLKFTNHDTRPPSRGAKIVYGDKNGCLPAFTQLKFGVLTNEEAQCKIDSVMKGKFDEMQYYMDGSNMYRKNHTESFRLPSPSAEGSDISPLLGSDGTFTYYIKCIDANGNENVDDFAVSFCIDKSPDTTPPVIEDSSISNNGYVRFDADKVPIEIYVNEPAECKWSRQDKAFEDMENLMGCDTKIYQINSRYLYTCRSNLTGIENKADNKFYFRCKDGPGKADKERNVNVQSYPLVLKGSQKLNILNMKPNETIIGSTTTVKAVLSAETDDGAEEGKAICSFSNTGVDGSFVVMFETDSHLHKQELDLTAGNYKSFFRCVDKGGNSASGNTSFIVEIDKKAPVVTRAYKEGGDAMKIVTDEDAVCKYSLNSCNFVFDEGLNMIYSNPGIKNNHYAKWDSSLVYYIKCRDEFLNEPSPNACSIVVKGVELAKK